MIFLPTPKDVLHTSCQKTMTWTYIRVRIAHIGMANYLSERKCVFVWGNTTKFTDFIPHLL